MKTSIISVLAASLLLAGCVSQQSQNALATDQAACNAGNRDACTAALYQAQANQQEQANNTAIATGIGAALLSGAIAGAAIAVDSQPYYYAPVYHSYRHR